MHELNRGDGPLSSSTPFDILTTLPGTTWPRFSRPRATYRIPPPPPSRLSNLRAPFYHPRRHLDRQLRDEMHGNRVEALITSIADSSRSIPDQTRKNQLSDVLKKESSPSIPPLVISALLSLLPRGKRLPRWNLRKLVI